MVLTYRRINVDCDGDEAFDNFRAACVASFGSAGSCCSQSSYLQWLSQRIEEFPDGHAMVSIDGRTVGQLEVQVPYGMRTGYINLFYVAPKWRRLGIGRQMHQFVEKYLHSWEATAVELHVSLTNHPAVGFYRSIGYRTVAAGGDAKVRLMRRDITLACSAARQI